MMMGMTTGHEALKIAMAGLVGAVANGTSITVTGSVTPIIVGGFPPYSFDWTDSMGGISVQASTSVSARLQATGTNTEHSGAVILRLSEANGFVTTVSADIVVTQGSP